MMSRFRHPAATALLVLAFTSSLAWADAFRALPLKHGASVSVAGYGRQNPECVEWTNGCVVCRAEAGHARCSTPGIACVPAGLTCRSAVRH